MIKVRVLVVGNITLDLLPDGRIRVGGSGYYGGRALSEYLDVDTYVLTYVDENYRGLVLGVLSSAGIKVLELRADGMPMFKISGGKAVEFQGVSPRIPSTVVESYTRVLGFNAVIFAPIMRELDIDLVRTLNKQPSTVVSLDLQGFVREPSSAGIACRWYEELEKGLLYADIVHGNIAEFCFSNNEHEVLSRLKSLSSSYGTVFLVSLDARGTYAVYRGEVFYIPSLPTSAVDDVGAGDVLLAVTTYYRVLGTPVLEAVVRGVIASSLKVENAYGVWFDKKAVEEIARAHINNVRVVEIREPT